jgi:hypothetical protein
MTDTATPGERLDTLIGELRTQADNLRAALEEFGNEARDDFASMIDALSAKVDEVQQEWAERRDGG